MLVSYRTRRVFFLSLAALGAVGTVMLMHSVRTAAPAPQVQTTAAPVQTAPMVLVASGELHSGQLLRSDNMRWQAWPDNAISPSYITSKQHRLEDYVGAVVRNAIATGEPITDTRVVRPGDRGFLAAVLTPGYRAVTVPITPSSGDGGFVFPGDHIDLILTLTFNDTTPNAARPQHFAGETVLSDIRVLALDQRADDQNKQASVARTVTLEVTPRQAESVAVAEAMGQLSLSLRSLQQNGTDPVPSKPSYVFDSDVTRLTPPPHVGKDPVVQVTKGDKVETDTISRR